MGQFYPPPSVLSVEINGKPCLCHKYDKYNKEYDQNKKYFNN